MTGPIPPKKRLPVGSIFERNGRMWRRGAGGRIYVAHPSDPTIERAFRKRAKARARRGEPFFAVKLTIYRFINAHGGRRYASGKV